MGLASPSLVGAVAGYGVAVVIVRLWGPSPVLERSAFTAAIRWALAAWVLALGDRDRGRHPRARRLIDGPAASARHPLRFVPWELVPVGLAVFAATRLGDSGGVQLLGAQTTRVDAWVLGFPLSPSWPWSRWPPGGCEPCSPVVAPERCDRRY